MHTNVFATIARVTVVLGLFLGCLGFPDRAFSTSRQEGTSAIEGSAIESDQRTPIAQRLSTITSSGRVGRSSVPPPAKNESVFVADDDGPDGYLDLYRNRTELPDEAMHYFIDIGRFYSPLMSSVDAQGFLTQDAYAKAISKGVLPEEAILYLQVFDVDEEGHPDWPCPEKDEVYINGRQLMKNGQLVTLSGANDTWSAMTIAVPTNYLKFPTPPAGHEQRQGEGELWATRAKTRSIA